MTIVCLIGFNVKFWVWFIVLANRVKDIIRNALI